MWERILGRYIFILMAPSLLACHDLKLQAGHYEGLLTQGAGWSPHSKKKSNLSELVGIEINPGKQKSVDIQVSTLRQNESFLISVKKVGYKSYSILLPKLGLIYFNPKKYPSSSDSGGMDCYSDYSLFKISFCTAYDEFTLSIEDGNSQSILALSGGRFHREVPFSLEEPREMKVSEAIKLAIDKNFASRIEYQTLMRSKEVALAAYLNLIPHVRIYTGLSIANYAMTLSPLALLSNLHDFGPFLFPNRWLQAESLSLQAKAAQDSYRIMQANLGNQVEGFIYNYIGHKSQLAIYGKLVQVASETLQKVYLLEKNGKIEHGASATLRTIEKNLQFSQIIMGSAISADRQAISMALGFLNPDAVENITLDFQEKSMDDVRPLDAKAVAQIALNRSMEARQIDFLIEAFHKERVALLFSWMDPYGAPFSPLGFNLIPQMKAAKSQIQTLVLQKEQRRQEAVQKGIMTVKRYNKMIQAYRASITFKEEQENRLKDILAEINHADPQSIGLMPGVQTRVHEIQDVFQDLVGASLLVEGLLSNFRALRATIERLLLVGYLSQLSDFPTQVNLGELELVSDGSLHENLDSTENGHLNQLLNLMRYFQK